MTPSASWSSMSERSVSDRRQNPRWVPLLAVLPLFALLIADVVMTSLAVGSDPGVVADAPRRIGLARLAPGTEMKLQVSVTRRDQGYRVSLELRDPQGNSIPATAAEGRLERPTHAGADQRLAFTQDPRGVWISDVRTPDRGAWQITVAASDQNGRSAIAVARLTD